MTPEYDFIIVGSGSAGGFLALRLSEGPNNRVLLLESGPSDAHWTTRIPAGARYTFSGGPRNWCFETAPARRPTLRERLFVRRDLSPRGKGAALLLPVTDTKAMPMHRDEIGRHVTANAHGAVRMDRAGWHGTDKLQGSQDHHDHPAPIAVAGVEPGREYLAISTPELAFKPRLQ